MKYKLEYYDRKRRVWRTSMYAGSPREFPSRCAAARKCRHHNSLGFFLYRVAVM